MTNLAVYGMAESYYGWPGWSCSNIVMNPPTSANVSEILLGSAVGNGASHQNFAGVIHGFVAISNYLSATQIQQIFALAENTVLPWRRLVFEGDSMAWGLASSLCLETNNNFWGNCAYESIAGSGTTIEQIVDRFYSTAVTNMPNGLDIIYPPTVIFWGGQNSFLTDTAAQIEAGIQWEINAMHACGARVYISTWLESLAASETPGIEANREALNAWVLSGQSGAEGVVDNDTMFYNLFGTNYYTNLTYFDGTTHPNALGYSLVATNFNAVIGTNILTPNNLYHSFH